MVEVFIEAERSEYYFLFINGLIRIYKPNLFLRRGVSLCPRTVGLCIVVTFPYAIQKYAAHKSSRLDNNIPPKVVITG
jgi:hypothetical protein